MIKAFIVSLIGLLYCRYARAQSCGYINIKNKIERKAIEDYIHDCALEKEKRFLGEYFEGDTGVVVITIKEPDEFSQVQWGMSILHRYDSYKSHPLGTPIGWSKVSNKIVLWYRQLAENQLKDDKLVCLQNLVYPHLIKIPLLPLMPRLPDGPKDHPIRLDKDGSIWTSVGPRKTYSGGGYSSVVFKKNGSVERLKAL